MEAQNRLLVILGAGESGVGAAILAQAKGWRVFVSDGANIKPSFQQELNEQRKEEQNEQIKELEDVFKKMQQFNKDVQQLKKETIKVWGNCGMCKAKIEKAAKKAALEIVTKLNVISSWQLRDSPQSQVAMVNLCTLFLACCTPRSLNNKADSTLKRPGTMLEVADLMRASAAILETCMT